MTRGLSLRRVPMKNIRAHPIRAGIILILALAQAACVFGGLILIDGMRHELLLAEQRLGADVVVYPTTCLNQVEKERLLMLGTPVQCRQERSTLSRMDDNQDIEAISHQLYVADTLTSGEPLWIVGFDPATDFVLSPWMSQRGTELPRGSLAVGSKVQESHNGTVALFHRQRPIAAHLMETGSQLDNAVFVSMDTLSDIIQDSVDAGVDTYASLRPDRDYSAVLVRVADKESVQSVTNWINLYVRKVTAVRSEAALVDTASNIRSHRGITVGVLGVSWLVLMAALIVAQFTLMNERQRELYVWRSIGASRTKINRVMMHESLLIHSAGACAGVLSAAALLPLLGDAPIYEALTTPGRALPLAGVTIAFLVLAGVAGTRLALGRLSRASKAHKPVSV